MKQFAPRISEAETDAVLERLLLANGEACRRFLAYALSETPSSRILRVGRQTRHTGSSGTIDLDVTLASGQRLLVENKIDAGWSVTRQGEWQPDRYRRSVEALRERGLAARSVLVAPQTYLSGSRQATLFDARVSYEAFVGELNGADATRMQTAIRQAETPYEPVPNAQTGDFFVEYAGLVQVEFPKLSLKVNPNGEGARPTGSRTFYFDAKRMLRDHSGMPRPRISVQAWDSAAPMASAKLIIGGWGPLANAYPAPDSLGAIGSYLRPAGRSLGLVIDTPHLETQRPLEEQVDAVRQGLTAIDTLRRWWNQHGTEMVNWHCNAQEA